MNPAAINTLNGGETTTKIRKIRQNELKKLGDNNDKNYADSN